MQAVLSTNLFLTTCDSKGDAIGLLEPQNIDAINGVMDSKSAVTVVDIDFSVKYQKILGFGAGLPQSSAYVLSMLKEKNLALYDDVMQHLFNKSVGAGMNILRFPIGSCDFSLHNESYDEIKDDYDLNHFVLDIDSEKYIVNILLDALKINPKLTVMASPWSAPSWLKVFNTLLGMNNSNTLINSNEAYETYATYFVLVYEAYAAKGIHISYFMLQNEPLFGDNTQYPGMYFNSQQALRLGLLVRKKLNEKGYKSHDIKLLAYDHNWDAPEYPLDVLHSQLNTEEPLAFVGTAWHCYAGNMETALNQLYNAFPYSEQHITECTGVFPQSTCDINRGMEGFGNNHG